MLEKSEYLRHVAAEAIIEALSTPTIIIGVIESSSCICIKMRESSGAVVLLCCAVLRGVLYWEFLDGRQIK